ncbi:MAG: M24 family metallopeptidase [Phycisphaerales bacterium]
MTTTLLHPDTTADLGAFAALRESGRRLMAALESARAQAIAGASTAEVAGAVAEAIEAAGGECVLTSERNARGEAFGWGASVNVNEQAACARPGARRLRAGDLVTIDAAARFADLDDRIVDASIAMVVPGADAPEREALVADALEAVEIAAGLMRPGVLWSAVAEAVQAFARERGWGLATGVAGHGVGRTLHEGPLLATFADEAPRADFEIREGMLLCVEPVLTLPASPNGTPEAAGRAQGGYPSLFPRRTPTIALPDGWGVATADRSPACCQERTIGVGPDGGVILTAA